MSRWSGDDFEPWLERELQQAVGSVRGPSARAEQAAYRAVRTRRGPLAVKSIAAIVAVALAVAGGVTGVAAMTGNPNAVNLGHRVVEAVTSAGQHGSTPSVKPPDAAANEAPYSASPRPKPAGEREGDATPEPIQSGVLRRSYEKDQGEQQGQQGEQRPQSDRPDAGDNSAAKPKRDKRTPASPPSPTAGP